MEVDLAAPGLALAVEIDGYYHFRDADAYRRDRRKDFELQKQGFLVVRVLADDVVRRLEEVLDQVLAAVASRRSHHPQGDKLMNAPSELTLVDQLVLARLLVAGEKGATTSELKKALDPLLGHRLAGAALADRLAQALAALDSAGLAHRTRKGKTERGTLTPEGERRALEFLGIDRLPPKTNWDQIKKSLPGGPRLGLPTPRDKAVKAFSGDPGFKAALLKTQFDLPVGDYPTFDQALDALAWKLLGFADASGAKFNVKAREGRTAPAGARGPQRRSIPRPTPRRRPRSSWPRRSARAGRTRTSSASPRCASGSTVRPQHDSGTGSSTSTAAPPSPRSTSTPSPGE